MQTGQICVTFWDSTFDYSWRKKTGFPKFLPCKYHFLFWGLFFSEERINRIKNRYQSTVTIYKPSFGNFFKTFQIRKKQKIYHCNRRSWRRVFEKGHLFHCSHIVQEQTRVQSTICTLGKNAFEKRWSASSQMDVFPRNLHRLSNWKSPSFLQDNQCSERKSIPLCCDFSIQCGTAYAL